MSAPDLSPLFQVSWRSGAPAGRELHTPPRGVDDYPEVIRLARERGARSFLLHPLTAETLDLARRLHEAEPTVEFHARPAPGTPLPAFVRPLAAGEAADVTLFLEQDGGRLSSLLHDFIDQQAGLLVIPATERHFSRQPLFLISIPKSGTHLLYGLAEAFGYRRGVVCPETPEPQTWYCVEYSNSHTSARDFFIDTVRSQPFGNRSHPFPRCPAILIYRNPLDIVVSEANYYHKPGRTAFSHYFDGLDFRQRLRKLIGDDWLLGSLRSRIGAFAPWLALPNVAPVAFEELVGAQGGGSDALQADVLWSLQLKLQVPGVPEEFGRRVFNRDSATFNEGRIGGYREHMDAGALRAFFALPQDFMEIFGYGSPPLTLLGRGLRHLISVLTPGVLSRWVPLLPTRRDEFRRRRLELAGETFFDTPITVEYNYLDLYNITRYKGKYIAIPHGFDGADLDAIIASPPPTVFVRNHLERVKRVIDQRYLALTAAPAATSSTAAPPTPTS